MDNQSGIFVFACGKITISFIFVAFNKDKFDSHFRLASTCLPRYNEKDVTLSNGIPSGIRFSFITEFCLHLDMFVSELGSVPARTWVKLIAACWICINLVAAA